MVTGVQQDGGVPVPVLVKRGSGRHCHRRSEVSDGAILAGRLFVFEHNAGHPEAKSSPGSSSRSPSKVSGQVTLEARHMWHEIWDT